jgi:hypothetical protein
MLKSICIGCFLLVILASCGGKDEKFCKCLEVSERLNTLSNDALTQEVTPKSAKKMKAMKVKKKELCADYEVMAGPEMLELKAECTK